MTDLHFWWLSSARMTVGVVTDGYKLIDGPPIVSRFMGQHLHNLGNWMMGHGGFTWFQVF